MTPPAARPERIATVLLDAGGVLLDLDYAYLRRLLAAREIAVDVATLSEAEAFARTEIERRVRGGGRTIDAWRDYFRIIMGRAGLPVDQHDTVIDSLWEAHQRVGLWTVAIPGGPDAVRALKDAGYRVAVVSNAEGQVERDLESAGYAGLLELVVDSHVVGVEKPDPAIFGLALERLGMSADTAVYVGDVPSVDVVGARAAGVFPILLDRHDLYRDVDVPRLHAIADLHAWLDGD